MHSLAVQGRGRRRSSVDQNDINYKVISPCWNDPFWDHYSAVGDDTRVHPQAFQLPGMAAKRRSLLRGAQRFRSEFEKQVRKQHLRMSTAIEQRLNFGAFAVFDWFDDESWVDFRNFVGCLILCCLDQQSFIAASLVCRAWFYCSRVGFARSHIR